MHSLHFHVTWNPNTTYYYILYKGREFLFVFTPMGISSKLRPSSKEFCRFYSPILQSPMSLVYTGSCIITYLYMWAHPASSVLRLYSRPYSLHYPVCSEISMCSGSGGDHNIGFLYICYVLLPSAHLLSFCSYFLCKYP